MSTTQVDPGSPTAADALEPVGIAVVGLGYWGPNLVRNLQDIPSADLLVACDRDESALANVARRYPSVLRTTSFEDILTDDDVEAVVLATPVGTHYRLARAALEAGKHVFVEKPLASSADEARDLIARAGRAELTLMPGHTFLYSPPVRMIRELITSGELGDIWFVSSSRVNLGLHQSDASVVWDLGPHDFSILQFWLDERPRYVSALSRGCFDPTTPDVAFINLEYASRTIAHVELSWLAPSKLRRTAIVGSKKMVVYDDTSNEPVRLFDSGVALPDPESFGEFRLSYRTGDIVSPRVEGAEPLALELTDFCESVRLGRSPRSDAAIGLAVIEVIEAVDASLEREGARIEVARSRDPAAA